MKYVAIMPLRGGSKSIPKKNIKLIAGKPLFFWALNAAFESMCFESIYVSTDSPEIKQEVQNYFPSVIVLDRDPELATDAASTESVLFDFQKKVDFDVLCLIQATSPLTTAADFIGAQAIFTNGHYDSLLTVAPSKHFFWNSEGKPLNYDPKRRPRRQDFDGCYIENGAFYFTKAHILKSERCRLGGKIAVYPMSEESVFEIDELKDWVIIEQFLIAQH